MNDVAPKTPLDPAGAALSKNPTDPADRILNGLGDAPPPMRSASESHGENSASFYGDPKPVIDRQPTPPQEEAVIISLAPDPSRSAETEVTIRKRKPGADDTGTQRAHTRSVVWVLAMFVVLGGAGAVILWSLGHRRQPEAPSIVAPLATGTGAPPPTIEPNTATPSPLPTINVAPPEATPAASPSVAPKRPLPGPIKPKKRDIAPGL